MRTMGSVSTITDTMSATATVSLVSPASGVKWVRHMHVHTCSKRPSCRLGVCLQYIIHKRTLLCTVMYVTSTLYRFPSGREEMYIVHLMCG